MTLRPISTSLMYLMLVSFVFMNTADAFITAIAIVTESGKEMNPIMGWIQEEWGITEFIVFKMVLSPILAGVFFWYRRWTITSYITLLVVTLYFVTCCFHVYGVLITGMIPGIGPV